MLWRPKRKPKSATKRWFRNCAILGRLVLLGLALAHCQDASKCHRAKDKQVASATNEKVVAKSVHTISHNR